MTADLLATAAVIVAILLAVVVALIHNGSFTKTEPAVEILYTFTSSSAPLIAHGYGLVGQATTVVRSGGLITVIVERSTKSPAMLSRADALFLAGEGLVAEEALGVSVNTVILRFADRDQILPLTVAMRSIAIQRINSMRVQMVHGPTMKTQDPAVCRTCEYRSLCPIGRINVALPHSTMGEHKKLL